MKRQGPSQQRTCNSPLPIEMNVDPLAKPRRIVLLRDAPDHKSILTFANITRSTELCNRQSNPYISESFGISKSLENCKKCRLDGTKTILLLRIRNTWIGQHHLLLNRSGCARSILSGRCQHLIKEICKLRCLSRELFLDATCRTYFVLSVFPEPDSPDIRMHWFFREFNSSLCGESDHCVHETKNGHETDNLDIFPNLNALDATPNM